MQSEAMFKPLRVWAVKETQWRTFLILSEASQDSAGTLSLSPGQKEVQTLHPNNRPECAIQQALTSLQISLLSNKTLLADDPNY